MDKIPKELEETPLNLEVVIDPTTKCFTMKTQINRTPTESNELTAPNVIASDPLHGGTNRNSEVDLTKMNELEILIHSERERILNLTKPTIVCTKKPQDHNADEDYDRSNQLSDSATTSETEPREDVRNVLSRSEKTKLRRHRRWERETSEERDFRRYRQRIATMKLRFMAKIHNFDNETYFRELNKKHTAKIRQKRRELKEKETPEQRELRKSLQNIKSRMRYMKRKAFKTPEELAYEKEKRLSTLEKYWAKHTDAERSARQKVKREKARERYRKSNEELKRFDRFLKGAPLEILERSDE